MLNRIAQDINLNPTGQFQNLTTFNISRIVTAAISLILIIASLIFFFILVLGGIKWITSGGDKGQTEAARNQITAALIGLVIVFAAWAIVNIVETFFNVSILGGFNLPF